MREGFGARWTLSRLSEHTRCFPAWLRSVRARGWGVRPRNVVAVRLRGLIPRAAPGYLGAACGSRGEWQWDTTRTPRPTRDTVWPVRMCDVDAMSRWMCAYSLRIVHCYIESRCISHALIKKSRHRQPIEAGTLRPASSPFVTAHWVSVHRLLQADLHFYRQHKGFERKSAHI